MDDRITNGTTQGEAWAVAVRGRVSQGDDKNGDRLQRAIWEVTNLKQALTASQKEVQAARLHVETLHELNARLNRELIELARREAQARDFAYHDELTRLPNRRLLRDRLEQVLAQAARQHKEVALLLVDLDGFKRINDRLGHTRGDELLQAVAQRITVNIRGADTACRYGGDEFAIILPAVDNPRVAAAVATKLRRAMDDPYLIKGYEIRLAASIGSVVYPADGQTYEELLRKADEALYRAKAASREAAVTPLAKEKAGQRSKHSAAHRPEI